MTAVVGEALVVLKTDDSAVQKGAATSGQTAGKKFGGGFASAAKTAVAAAGLLAVGAAATALVKNSVAEAREAQKVGATTEAIIASTGGAAKVTADQVGELASSLSAKVGMDDELIQTGANLILTFKNIRNEAGKNNDIFNQATEAALDLSAAGFGSVDSASKMLGKALNDPVKGITALSRAGVTFTEQQKDQITAMAESGDMLGAQKAILKEVQGQVGGVAEATATASDKSAVAWGNIQEQLGAVLIPILDAVASVLLNQVFPAISAVVGALGSLAGFVSENATWFKVAAAALLVLLAPMIAINAVGLAMAAMFAVQAAAIAAWNTIVTIATAVTNAWRFAMMLLNTAFFANPIGLIVLAIVALVAIIVVAWKKSETFRTVVLAVWSGIKAAVEAVVNWFKGPFADFFTQTLPQFFKSAWERVKQVVSLAVKALLIVIGGFPLLAFVLLRKFGPQIVQIFKTAWTNAKTAVTTGISNVVSVIKGVPGKISALAGNFLSAGKTIGGKIIEGIKSGLSSAVGFATDLASAVKKAINSALGLPKTISVGVGKFKASFTIPAFAQGGVIARPTVGLVGEAGPEAVVPLRRGAPWAPGLEAQVAQALAARQGATTVTLNIYPPSGDPEAIGMAVLNRLATAGIT